MGAVDPGVGARCDNGGMRKVTRTRAVGGRRVGPGGWGVAFFWIKETPSAGPQKYRRVRFCRQSWLVHEKKKKKKEKLDIFVVLR